MNEPVLVLIPVNRLDRAKGRLATYLAPDQRRELFLATLRTVLDAVAGAGCDAVLLTPDREVVRAFPGVRIVKEEPALSGLNAQLEFALSRVPPPPAGILILHADLPLVTPAALKRLVAASPEAPSATIVRSRDGGTNAMLLRPPGRFALAYGPNSGTLHEHAATAAGVAVRVLDEPALQLDLDTPADLLALLDDPAGAASRAGRLLASFALDLPMAKG